MLDAVYHGLLWFCENWKNHKTDYCGSTIIEPMSVVYAVTGDQRLLDFCMDWLAWLEEHSHWPNSIGSYLSDDLFYNSMHAVAYGECVKNPIVVSCVTGNETYRKAGLNGLRKALRKIVQNTGAPSSCTEFLSPKGASSETEYCNFATYCHSYSWAALATGEACWGDEIERTVFNGAQGARKKDEKAIAYFTSPNQLRANRESSLYGESAEYGVYAPCYHVACCPCQSVRILPEFLRSMVLTDDRNDLYFLLYAPAEIRTKTLSVRVDTLYPFRESLTLTVTHGGAERLYFRVPSWCQRPHFSLNGKPVQVFVNPNGFAEWETPVKAGDTVGIFFPMEVAIERIDDTDFARQYPLSVTRGPLVYSLPVPTKWTKYPGRPITPLPDGWAWAEAEPDLHGIPGEFPHDQYYNAPWAKAIDETITPDKILVTETEPKGYVWENPPVTLSVLLYHARFAYSIYSPRTPEPFAVPLATDGIETRCRLVPYGCTNLRITYLPRAAKPEQKK